MTLDPAKTIEYGEYLLSLPEEERAVAGKALNRQLMAATPDEDIGKPPVQKLGPYLDQPVETPPILVEPGLVGVGAISALVSRGGKGKTALSLNRLIRWSMGKPLFDDLPNVMKPIRPLKILVIENEGNGGHFQRVIQTILDGNDFAQEDKDAARENMWIWGDGGWSGLKLDREEDFALVDRAAGITEADIVFVEPFRGLWRGDENSSTDMAVVCDAMSEIANTHSCAVMLTHHERKSGAGDGPDADPMSAARGSGVLEGAAAVMERWVPVKAGAQRELSQTKFRFDDPYAPMRVEFERERWGYRYVAENEKLNSVLAILAREPGQWLPLAVIAEELGEDKQRVRRWLNAMVEDDEFSVDRQMQAGAALYRYTGGGGVADATISI